MPLSWQVVEILFQHAAARRRLDTITLPMLTCAAFQHAAARRRLGPGIGQPVCFAKVSTRSRPKAAGSVAAPNFPPTNVSTRSRPKAAGPTDNGQIQCFAVSTRSRPKAAGRINRVFDFLFQVSTRSRPKVAGRKMRFVPGELASFNTQPPEGGWRRFKEIA